MGFWKEAGSLAALGVLHLADYASDFYVMLQHLGDEMDPKMGVVYPRLLYSSHKGASGP